MNYWLAGYPPGDRLEPWIYLSNSSFWGRVTVCCGDLCFFADFGRVLVIFGLKLAVFELFDDDKKVRFCSDFFYRGLWLPADSVKRVSGASEQIEGVN